VSDFGEENVSYTAPSLALKIGHSLQKIADIIHCRALMTENEGLIKSTEAFKSLYSLKWCAHSALNTLVRRNSTYHQPCLLDLKAHDCYSWNASI